jgi:hypothetical protein
MMSAKRPLNQTKAVIFCFLTYRSLIWLCSLYLFSLHQKIVPRDPEKLQCLFSHNAQIHTLEFMCIVNMEKLICSVSWRNFRSDLISYIIFPYKSEMWLSYEISSCLVRGLWIIMVLIIYIISLIIGLFAE